MKIIKFEASVSWRKIKILAKRIMNSRIILFYSMMVAIAEKKKFDQFQTANINRKIVPEIIEYFFHSVTFLKIHL